MLFVLCSCNKTTQSATPTQAPTTASTLSVDGTEIIGTWVCDDISKDCYFIFDEKGDAYAKMGSSTVYGYYDYYADENLFDISLTGFLFNEYEAHFGGDTMTLISDESRYTFKKAQLPEISIKKPDNLSIDKNIIGDWQSPESYECYRFNEDTTAVITDMYNDATLDCFYTCDNGKITMYYMTSETIDSTMELTYSFDGATLLLNDLSYEKVSA